MTELSSWLSILLLIFLLAWGAISYQKLSMLVVKQNIKTRQGVDNAYKQLEALQAIYVELGLSHALPSTRGWAGSPDFLRVLMDCVLKKKPNCIVECSSGVSTVILARSVQINGYGHIISLEHDPMYAQATRDLLVKFGLEEHATIVDAPLEHIEIGDWSGRWYSKNTMSNLEFIDMLVIDGPPYTTGNMARYPAVPIFHSKLSAGALVIADDTNREDDSKMIEKWVDRYPELLIAFSPECEKGCTIITRKA